MMHPPTTSELPLARSSDSPKTMAEGILATSTSISAADSLPLSSDEVGQVAPLADRIDSTLVDQSGRSLGPRALRTRARILEATVSLLENKSMRDLRVIDIARSIGSSPATFYQYFKDVNDVVLELATEVSEFTPDMIELIHGDWTGSAGHERGRRLANLVTDYWDRYRAILRVRNNAADEGDPAFKEVRLKAMLPMVTAFAEVIEAAHATTSSEGASDLDRAGGQIRPFSGAMFMFTALESTAVHHEIFEARFGPMGEGREALVETIATILQSTLTSKR